MQFTISHISQTYAPSPKWPTLLGGALKLYSLTHSQPYVITTDWQKRILEITLLYIKDTKGIPTAFYVEAVDEVRQVKFCLVTKWHKTIKSTLVGTGKTRWWGNCHDAHL